MIYTITLTDVQHKALSYVAVDPESWINNLVDVRCREAISEIIKLEVERITSSGGEISGTSESIVLSAPIKSAREREEELISERLAAQQQQASDAEAAQQEEETLVRESYENL